MCVLRITECRMHSLPLATQHHDGGHSISTNAMHVHTLDHKCCRAWQVFVMGPVIGDVNAGASIVKAMLVTSACMHLAPLSTPFAWRVAPSCRDGSEYRARLWVLDFHCRAC